MKSLHITLGLLNPISTLIKQPEPHISLGLSAPRRPQPLVHSVSLGSRKCAVF